MYDIEKVEKYKKKETEEDLEGEDEDEDEDWDLYRCTFVRQLNGFYRDI